jgi:hypothetical protein
LQLVAISKSTDIYDMFGIDMRRIIFSGLITVIFASAYSGILEKSKNKTPHQKSYHVVIVPICNAGNPCDPKFPKELENLFFRNPAGVANYFRNQSPNITNIYGKTLPWILPSHKIKKYADLLDQLPKILDEASKNNHLGKYDIILIYVNTPGNKVSLGLPMGQNIIVSNEELTYGLGFMINSSFYKKVNYKIKSSKILPSTEWADMFSEITNLPREHQQTCF